MQKNFGLCRSIEVSAFAPKQQVGHEASAASDMPAKLLELVIDQREPAECIASDQYNQQRWEYPLHAAAVEVREAEAVVIKV